MLLINDDTWGIMTVWGEARGEEYQGKVAVAEVIRNRMKFKYSSDGTAANTVLRKYQFSCHNHDDPNRILMAKLNDNDPVVKECIKAWNESKNTNLTKNAVLYCNLKVVSSIPSWAKMEKKTTSIGNHTFFID